jgi:hypothetical protein
MLVRNSEIMDRVGVRLLWTHLWSFDIENLCQAALLLKWFRQIRRVNGLHAEENHVTSRVGRSGESDPSNLGQEVAVNGV